MSEAISNSHPWIHNFRINELWIKSYYALIGERIRDLHRVPYLNEIIQRLKDPIDPISASTEIDAGWKLYKGRVKFEYVPRTRESKTPDM